MNSDFPQINDVYASLESKNAKALDYLKSEYTVMRAGRANPKLIEKIMVNYYGSPTPINQMGNISVPEPRIIVITVWDKSALSLVEKAILGANIGVTPQNDGTIIRLTFPQLTEERRHDLVKQVKKLAEEAKVITRNNRRDAMEELKKIKASKAVSEDVVADSEKDVDKATAKQIEAIDKICKDKEADVMSV